MDYYFETLEFDKLIPLIGKYLRTYPGKQELSAITDVIKSGNASRELELTGEMARFLQFDSSISFEELSGIMEMLDNSSISGFVLGTAEFLEIKKSIVLQRDIEIALKPFAEKYPLLNTLFESVPDCSGLAHAISRIIDESGKVLDSASDELSRIRKRKSSARKDINSYISRLLEKKSVRDIIQENFITIRGDRFVVPIKAQHKNKLKSEFNYIINSFSKSGETAYIEPGGIIDLNNEIVEIDGLEAAEIDRILLNLTLMIRDSGDSLRVIFNLIGKLELIYAKARFALDYKCSIPEILTGRPCLRLKKARHPLLGPDSIPIDIEVGFDNRGLIISGPNAGGKTVALKCAGLLTLMALCGIPIPASNSSQVGYFTQIMAEIGDEQSISLNLSSFSGHILKLAKILADCGPGALILIDEIASSTEPREGEALGRSIILYLLEKGAKFIITTHFQALKEIAYSADSVRNAAVDIDEKNLTPLYTLRTGTTGSSYAIKIAKKYGLDDKIISEAENYLEQRNSSPEALMKKLENERNELVKKQEIAARHIEESREIKELYQQLLAELESEKREMHKKGIVKARKDLDDILQKISGLKEEIKGAGKNAGDSKLKSLRQGAREAQESLDESEKRIVREERSRPAAISAGMRVFVGGLNKEGLVEEILGEKIKVRLGILSVTADFNDIYEANSKTGREKTVGALYSKPEIPPGVFISIDVRGKTAEEALKTVEKSIDQAFVNGVSCLSVIHGKGEGILRKEIWKFLKEQDSIKSFDYARPDDGGQGKTIVYFK
jgi:DNA mismatch repair protein MutS2